MLMSIRTNLNLTSMFKSRLYIISICIMNIVTVYEIPEMANPGCAVIDDTLYVFGGTFNHSMPNKHLLTLSLNGSWKLSKNEVAPFNRSKLNGALDSIESINGMMPAPGDQKSLLFLSSWSFYDDELPEIMKLSTETNTVHKVAKIPPIKAHDFMVNATVMGKYYELMRNDIADNQYIIIASSNYLSNRIHKINIINYLYDSTTKEFKQHKIYDGRVIFTSYSIYKGIIYMTYYYTEYGLYQSIKEVLAYDIANDVIVFKTTRGVEPYSKSIRHSVQVDNMVYFLTGSR